MSERNFGRRLVYGIALGQLNIGVWFYCATYSRMALVGERAWFLIALGMVGVSLLLFWKVPVHAFTTLNRRSTAPENGAKWLRPWHRYLLPSMAPVIAVFAAWFIVDSIVYFATGALAPWNIPRLLVDYPMLKMLLAGLFVVQTVYLLVVGIYLEKVARP